MDKNKIDMAYQIRCLLGTAIVYIYDSDILSNEQSIMWRINKLKSECIYIAHPKPRGLI